MAGSTAQVYRRHWAAFLAAGVGVSVALGMAPAVAAPADPAAAVVPDFSPDRPGLADGSTVVGQGKFQIETGIQYEESKEDGVKARATSFPTLLR